MSFPDFATVDCDVCGAAFGEPCRSTCGCGEQCTSPICKLTREAQSRFEMYCAGGNRERVTSGLEPGDVT